MRWRTAERSACHCKAVNTYGNTQNWLYFAKTALLGILYVTQIEESNTLKNPRTALPCGVIWQ